MSEKSASILIGLGFLTLASSLVFFLYKIEIFNLSQPIDAAKFGQFGDTIGGVVGSLWTLASVILFYTSLQQQKIITTNSAHSIKQQGDALLIQSEELKRQNEALRIQIEELQLTRKEHSLSRAVHQEQTDINKELSEIHKKNSFENSFYAIMNIYNNIQTELVYEKDLFNKIKNEMLDKYPNYSRYRTCFKHSMELYTTIYFRNKDRISQHLKTIYRILKTIDSAPIKDDLKFYYSKILRAQLTEPELFIIYYNSHSPMGLNLRTLLIKYNILKHLLITNKAEFRKFTLHNEVNYKIQLFIEKLDLESKGNTNPTYPS